MYVYIHAQWSGFDETTVSMSGSFCMLTVIGDKQKRMETFVLNRFDTSKPPKFCHVFVVETPKWSRMTQLQVSVNMVAWPFSNIPVIARLGLPSTQPDLADGTDQDLFSKARGCKFELLVQEGKLIAISTNIIVQSSFQIFWQIFFW